MILIHNHIFNFKKVTRQYLLLVLSRIMTNLDLVKLPTSRSPQGESKSLQYQSWDLNQELSTKVTLQSPTELPTV